MSDDFKIFLIVFSALVFTGFAVPYMKKNEWFYWVVHGMAFWVIIRRGLK